MIKMISKKKVIEELLKLKHNYEEQYAYQDLNANDNSYEAKRDLTYTKGIIAGIDFAIKHINIF